MVSAHTHTANGQLIANGQNHYAFVRVPNETADISDDQWLTCDTFAALANVGPAWFGVETAHHGPDSGVAGKGDGCYLADFAPGGEADDVNPAID
jgi:hypothetical protein